MKNKLTEKSIMNYVIVCKKTGRHLRKATKTESEYYHDNQTDERHLEHKDRFPFAFTSPVDLNENELVDAFLETTI